MTKTADNALALVLKATYVASRLPTTWLALGDSITEGSGATDRDHRWINLAAGKLRAAAGISGGAGYLPAWQNTGWADAHAPWSWPGGTGDANWGKTWGGRVSVLAAGATGRLVVTGTSLDLWVHAYGGGPTVAVAVDGGTPVVIDTNTATEAGQRTHIPFPARGSHTITVTNTGSGVAAIGGAMVYDGDESTGLRLYDAAFSGATSQQIGAQTGSNLTLPALENIVGIAAPDFITIEAGINDERQSVPVADVITHIDTLIGGLRTVTPRARIMLVHCYAPAGETAAWQPYLDALRNYAATHRSVGVLDLADLMGGTATTSGLWQADGTHPSNAGHERIASHLADLLLR